MSLSRLSSAPALDSFAGVHGDSSGLDGYSPDGERDVIFPYLESNGRKAWLAIGRSMRFVGGGKQHVLTMFYGNDDQGNKGYSLVCGDTFIGGSLKGGADGARRRAEEAVDAAIADGTISSAKRDDLISQMMDNFSVYPNEAACNFYKVINSGTAPTAGCKHAKGLLARMRANAELRPLAVKLGAQFNALKGGSAAAASPKVVQSLSPACRLSLLPSVPLRCPC